MIPTFHSKRWSYSLRVGLTLYSILVLIIGQSMAIATIIAERSYSVPGKLSMIGLVQVITLVLVGLLEQTRR